MLLAACFLAGCIAIPPQTLITSRDPRASEPRDRVEDCAMHPTGAFRAAGGESPAPVPGATFSVLTWNIHKTKDAGWEDDLRQLSADSDVVLLQEATFADGLREQLETAGLSWELVHAFAINSNTAGVLTAAQLRERPPRGRVTCKLPRIKVLGEAA